MLKREKALFSRIFSSSKPKTKKKEKVIVTRRTKRLAQKTTSNKRAKQKKMSFFHFQEMVTQTPNPKDANPFFFGFLFFTCEHGKKERKTQKKRVTRAGREKRLPTSQIHSSLFEGVSDGEKKRKKDPRHAAHHSFFSNPFVT
jgi:hypothetical protein